MVRDPVATNTTTDNVTRAALDEADSGWDAEVLHAKVGPECVLIVGSGAEFVEVSPSLKGGPRRSSRGPTLPMRAGTLIAAADRNHIVAKDCSGSRGRSGRGLGCGLVSILTVRV